MTTATEHTFTARVNSKGMQGTNAKVEFDWKLPGSKFPFILYERDPDRVEGWIVGDSLSVHIARGSLKADKDGQYPSDYFWNLVAAGEPKITGEAHQDAKPAQHPAATATRAPEGIPVADRDRGYHTAPETNRIAALNAALLAAQLVQATPTRDELLAESDYFLAYIEAQTKGYVPPEHVCFKHAIPFRLWYDKAGNDVYVHRCQDGSYCQENAPTLPNRIDGKPRAPDPEDEAQGEDLPW